MTFDMTRALIDVETSAEGAKPVLTERIDDLKVRYPELTRILDRLQELEDLVEEYGDPQDLSQQLDDERYAE